ncbi:MAG: hypothetical protein ACYSSP_04925 [Planctomycetota bacterium]|jgi:hypothetical protein
MKLRLFFLFSLFLCLLVGCSKKEDEQAVEEHPEQKQQQIDEEHPIEEEITAELISLDRLHEMRNQKDTSVEAYKIRPCEALIVDHSSREFVLSEGQTAIGPRTIHLLRADRSKYYRMIWNQGEEILLNNATLLVVRGTQAFRRFKEGEEYFLAVGHDNFDDALPEERNFQVIALYRIEVTED